MRTFARDALLRPKLKDLMLDETVLIYVNRGFPGYISQMEGFNIEHIGRSFITMKDGSMISFIG